VSLLIHAGHEALIKNLFVMNQDPSLGYQDRINSGLHQVRLYMNGEQKIISVDDKVPCLKSNQLPLCSLTATEGELWLPILEKACAKLFQGYDKLMGLHTLDIIKALTTVPQVFIDHDRVSADDIWKSISANSSVSGGLNSLIFASNGTETSKDQGHTLAAALFAIQKVVEVFDPVNGNKERVLRIRDMGEKLDWTGDWSAGSSKWSPELKEHLGYN
jgi:hypothetical protein